MESRFFNDDQNDQTQDFGYGLAARIQMDDLYKNIQSRLQVFSRVDRADPSRQRFIIEEMFMQVLKENWTWFGGYKILNWSTAEAFHPTDVINSRNFDSPLENAEKLGELMFGGQYLSETVNISAFFMPLTKSPQLPTQNNRLSFAPQSNLIDINDVEFVNKDGEIVESDELVQQWALRFQFPVEAWEFNFYWVHHFDRTDFSVLQNLRNLSFYPTLTEVDHYAFSMQVVLNSWIFKMENAYRAFQEQTYISAFDNTLNKSNYAVSSLATEYSLSHQSGATTTFIIEFQEIYGIDQSQRFLINPFQRDLLVGARYAFNDVKAKTFFFGVIADLERGREILINSSYNQRLSDYWTIHFGARYIDAPSSSAIDFSGLKPLNNDHQIDVKLSRYF